MEVLEPPTGVLEILQHNFNTAVYVSQTSTSLPNSYDENFSFVIPEVAPKGGQVFVCSTKQNCDALYAYFDVLKGLAGPYLYQSPSGKVVVQLNSGLTPETGAAFEEVVQSLP